MASMNTANAEESDLRYEELEMKPSNHARRKYAKEKNLKAALELIERI